MVLRLTTPKCVWLRVCMTDSVQQHSCLQMPLGNTLQDVCQVIALCVYICGTHVQDRCVCVCVQGRGGGVELQLVCWNVRDVGVSVTAAEQQYAAEQQQDSCGRSTSSRCYSLLPTASVAVASMSAATAGVAAHACHTAVMLSFTGALTEPKHCFATHCTACTR